jgi:cysteinyl-tRNA synthetase
MKDLEKKLRMKVQKMSDSHLNWCLAAFGILALFAIFDIETLKKLFNTFLVEILGIRTETIATGEGNEDALRPFEQAVDFILEMRRTAKANKDWATSDLIRDRLAQIGFDVKDTKDGFEWSIKK